MSGQTRLWVVLGCSHRNEAARETCGVAGKRAKVWGMTLEAIQVALEQLPPDQLARWLSEREGQAWDEQLDRDFSAGWRGIRCSPNWNGKSPKVRLPRAKRA